MAIIKGLDASYSHVENGMSKGDMTAARKVANKLDEVIIFRSTGPWSKRWIEKGYPTKNFHVKGKSSDWGPQAGFVPYDGLYSKVGHIDQEAKKGTAKNQDGLNHQFAAKTQLRMTPDELRAQLSRGEESPLRFAISRSVQVEDTEDRFLFARRSGDNKEFSFRANLMHAGVYAIFVYPEEVTPLPDALLRYEASGKYPEPLEVMTSSEAGARNRPMTGDYDLMAVCPRWSDYANLSTKEISKEGLVFVSKGPQAGLSFAKGTNLDKVLDPSTMTGRIHVGAERGRDEHGDMGNLTPRILRCINELNAEMAAVGANAPFRRVHHNAESHRNQIFGALTSAEMLKGDGLPLTIFQPDFLAQSGKTAERYGEVATIETLAEFKEYASCLQERGYFVPKNWVWKMSIRDGLYTNSAGLANANLTGRTK